MGDQKKNVHFHNHFKKLGKYYYLTDWAGILIEAMEEVSLVFYIGSKGKVLLEKYGHPSVVNGWYERYKKEKHNVPGSSVVIFTSDFEVEELNKLISDDTYAQEFHDTIFNKNTDLQGVVDDKHLLGTDI